jgi:hypothetical protein
VHEVALALLLVVVALEADQALDPHQELDVVHRLGQEVVGADVLAADARGAVAQGGHEHDRQVGQTEVAADALAHLEPAHPRHHDVEQHQVDRAIGERRQRAGPVGRLDHVEALAQQDGLEQAAIDHLVVDHQDASHVTRHWLAVSVHRGTENSNVEPTPTALVTRIAPPSFSTSARVSASPMPEPFMEWSCFAPSCSKYVNSFG